MAAIFKTRQGHWRAQIRRKGKYVSSTFRLKTLAQEWVIETERLIDQGLEPSARGSRPSKTVGDLIELHIQDLLEVGKPLRRSKRAVMNALKQELGAVRISDSGLLREGLLARNTVPLLIYEGKAAQVRISFLCSSIQHHSRKAPDRPSQTSRPHYSSEKQILLRARALKAGHYFA